MGFSCSPTKVLMELEDLAGKVIEQYWKPAWLDSNFQGGMRRWGVHEHLDYSKKHELDLEEASQFFRDEHHVEYMLSILERLTRAVKNVHLELRSQLQPIASKLSKGLSSLPDDILTLIFEFANPPGEGTKQAIWLSHVSGRFRRVSFSACHLWTTLHSGASKEELDTLIARSGTKSDLAVDLSFPSSGGLEGTHSFMDDICIPLASRWRTLCIWSGSDETEDPEDPVTVDEVMRRVFARYNQLELPLLQELRVTQRRRDVDRGINSWTTEKFTPSWTMPNLHAMVCDGYIPLPSPTYSSLHWFTTSFSLAMEQHRDRFPELLAFLDSATGILNLDLTIRMFITRLQSFELVQRHCNSLTTFSFQFSPFRRDGMDLVRRLMGCLVMHNLATLSVSFEFRYDDLLEDPKNSDYSHSLVNYVFPDHATHTNLATFNLELTHTEQTHPWGQNHIRFKTVTIPLHEIPHVSSFSVKTFCKLKFDEFGVDPWAIYGWDSGFALRELRLHDCAGYDIEMLKKTIGSLKWRILDTLETFKLERCFHEGDYEAVLKEVGEERLRFVPIPRTKFCT